MEKKKAGTLRSKPERKRKAKKVPCTDTVEAKRKRVQAERSVQLGQMMLRLHKHRAKFPCGLGKGQDFGTVDDHPEWVELKNEEDCKMKPQGLRVCTKGEETTRGEVLREWVARQDKRDSTQPWEYGIYKGMGLAFKEVSS